MGLRPHAVPAGGQEETHSEDHSSEDLSSEDLEFIYSYVLVQLLQSTVIRNYRNTEFTTCTCTCICIHARRVITIGIHVHMVDYRNGCIPYMHVHVHVHGNTRA